MDNLTLAVVLLPAALFVGYGIPFICAVIGDWVERGKKPKWRRRFVTFAGSISCTAFIFDQAYRFNQMWAVSDPETIIVWAKMAQSLSVILFFAGGLATLLVVVFAVWCILENRQTSNQ